MREWLRLEGTLEIVWSDLLLRQGPPKWDAHELWIVYLQHSIPLE